MCGRRRDCGCSRLLFNSAPELPQSWRNLTLTLPLPAPGWVRKGAFSHTRRPFHFRRLHCQIGRRFSSLAVASSQAPQQFRECPLPLARAPPHRRLAPAVPQRRHQPDRYPETDVLADPRTVGWRAISVLVEVAQDHHGSLSSARGSHVHPSLLPPRHWQPNVFGTTTVRAGQPYLTGSATAMEGSGPSCAPSVSKAGSCPLYVLAAIAQPTEGCPRRQRHGSPPWPMSERSDCWCPRGRIHMMAKLRVARGAI
jgi:hypothetical protein